jgi:hypothetical protein
MMNKFGCPVCLSPALVYPKVLEDDQPVTCADCGAFVSTYGELKGRAEADRRSSLRLLNPSLNNELSPNFAEPGPDVSQASSDRPLHRS